jgi:hypothetical protein
VRLRGTADGGNSFTPINSVLNDFENTVCWCDSLGLWVMGGSKTGGGFQVLATSTDGVNWDLQTTPWDGGFAATVSGLAWSPTLGRIVATGTDDPFTRAIMVSDDGISWTNKSSFMNGTFGRGASWLSGLGGLFVVGSGGGGSAWATSPDGDTWTARHTVRYME